MMAPDLVERAKQVIVSRIPASQMAIAVLSAALPQEVLLSRFGSHLAFTPYRNHFEATLGPDVKVLGIELEALHFGFDTLIRRLYLRRISTPGFRHEVATNLVDGLVRGTLTAILAEHLSAQVWTSQPCPDALEQWIDALTTVVTDALIFELGVSCARESH